VTGLRTAVRGGAGSSGVRTVGGWGDPGLPRRPCLAQIAAVSHVTDVIRTRRRRPYLCVRWDGRAGITPWWVPPAGCTSGATAGSWRCAGGPPWRGAGGPGCCPGGPRATGGPRAGGSRWSADGSASPAVAEGSRQGPEVPARARPTRARTRARPTRAAGRLATTPGRSTRSQPCWMGRGRVIRAPRPASMRPPHRPTRRPAHLAPTGPPARLARTAPRPQRLTLPWAHRHRQHHHLLRRHHHRRLRRLRHPHRLRRLPCRLRRLRHHRLRHHRLRHHRLRRPTPPRTPARTGPTVSSIVASPACDSRAARSSWRRR
jgi:hypothetical protein